MPDPTYQSEMSQPVHQPGMEGPVNRGPQHAVASEGDERDSSGNREGARRTVSAPTQSAFGPVSKSDPPPKSTPAPAAAAPAEDSPGAGIGGKIRTQKILSQVDAMS